MYKSFYVCNFLCTRELFCILWGFCRLIWLFNINLFVGCTSYLKPFHMHIIAVRSRTNHTQQQCTRAEQKTRCIFENVNMYHDEFYCIKKWASNVNFQLPSMVWRWGPYGLEDDHVLTSLTQLNSCLTRSHWSILTVFSCASSVAPINACSFTSEYDSLSHLAMTYESRYSWLTQCITKKIF